MAVLMYGESRHDTFLKKVDPRIKLLSLIVLTIIVSGSGPISLTIITALGCAGIVSEGMINRSLFRSIRGLLVLALLIPLAKLIAEPTLDGLLEGGLRAFRFIVILILGIVFTLSTKNSEVRNAFVVMLSHIPFVPAGRIGTQIGLSLSTIPLILEEAKRIREAQVSRLADQGRNPVKRITCLIIPLFVGVFTRAQEMAEAMESRSYTDDRTLPELSLCKRDAYFSLAVVAVCLLCILIQRR
jgi:energy-coupling factor transporter transmembrane protein EcfT